jgi:hypothetical protein
MAVTIEISEQASKYILDEGGEITIGLEPFAGSC